MTTSIEQLMVIHLKANKWFFIRIITSLLTLVNIYIFSYKFKFIKMDKSTKSSDIGYQTDKFIPKIIYMPYTQVERGTYLKTITY